MEQILEFTKRDDLSRVGNVNSAFNQLATEIYQADKSMEAILFPYRHCKTACELANGVFHSDRKVWVQEAERRFSDILKPTG